MSFRGSLSVILSFRVIGGRFPGAQQELSGRGDLPASKDRRSQCALIL
ncbi:hypothetical protein LptCag_0692 [Leptospirillum ferriphilum]|uniref:Uncharacterized protein n=1 Tax=Leptospirillum ferriphilum TaxID=178606 RepID=A0A094YLI9_9BACT|nr:hypothetical protein LptCag_0692 [Leptospirillum ferriphilum]